MSEEPMRVDEELGTYLRVLWRYKWVVAACAIIASMVALGISLQLTPLYSATATLRVASAPGGAADWAYMSSLTRLSNTYVEIATSDTTLDDVAKRNRDNKLYIGELQYINTLVIEAIDRIINESDVPPIIVVQSDHGSRLYPDHNHSNETNSVHIA